MKQNNMNKNLNMTISSGVALVGMLVLAVLFIGLIINQPKEASGASPTGTANKIATSTFVASTADTVQLLFATSTNCTSRVIGTQSEIKLTFSDSIGQRPTGANGHIQVASTTVVYDSGLYGCDAIYVYPYGTDTISISEAY